MCFSFPGATNETLLQKFHKENKNNEFYEVPQKFEHAFLINHYAGKVKYQVSAEVPDQLIANGFAVCASPGDSGLFYDRRLMSLRAAPNELGHAAIFYVIDLIDYVGYICRRGSLSVDIVGYIRAMTRD